MAFQMLETLEHFPSTLLYWFMLSFLPHHGDKVENGFMLVTCSTVRAPQRSHRPGSAQAGLNLGRLPLTSRYGMILYKAVPHPPPSFVGGCWEAVSHPPRWLPVRSEIYHSCQLRKVLALVWKQLLSNRVPTTHAADHLALSGLVMSCETKRHRQLTLCRLCLYCPYNKVSESY